MVIENMYTVAKNIFLYLFTSYMTKLDNCKTSEKH